MKLLGERVQENSSHLETMLQEIGKNSLHGSISPVGQLVDGATLQLCK
jgi:hypothetical protein